MTPAVRMPYRTLLALLIWICCPPAPAAAQRFAVASDLLFYGDNTEFSNPFRAGETVLGASGRVLLDIAFNEAVRLRGGVFGLGRFASHEFLEHAEPAIALELSRGGSRFIFGSLETTAWRDEVRGPDLETPHGLLPPLQQETLTFTRGQEMGLQWLVQRPRLEQDAWINWQRLNTASARERFDAGYRAAVGIGGAFRLHGQWHVVHEGGQQYAVGPVHDSQAAAAGVEWSTGGARAKLTLDAHAFVSRHVPDRDRPDQSETGAGFFTRGSLERGDWRTHLIVWRGRDTLKDEGDANYLAARRDGRVFHGVRDYAELGVTRHFRPAREVHLFAAFRIHRIDASYEYSYRIVARVRLRRQL